VAEGIKICSAMPIGYWALRGEQLKFFLER
jgi:hypothetical protein